MKRWILVRASSPLAPSVQRAKGRGTITATPAWIDSMEAPDYYAKLVRKGFLAVLAEADAKPVPAPIPEPPPPAAAPTKATKAPKSAREE